jgi:hypothetical protein
LSDLEILNKYESSENRHKPYIEDGCWNAFFFSYMTKLVNLALKRPFDFELMYKPEEDLDLDYIHARFKKAKGSTFI